MATTLKRETLSRGPHILCKLNIRQLYRLKQHQKVIFLEIINIFIEQCINNNNCPDCSDKEVSSVPTQVQLRRSSSPKLLPRRN